MMGVIIKSNRITSFDKFSKFLDEVSPLSDRRVSFYKFLKWVGHYLKWKYKANCRFKIIEFERDANLRHRVKIFIYKPSLGITSIRIDRFIEKA